MFVKILPRLVISTLSFGKKGTKKQEKNTKKEEGFDLVALINALSGTLIGIALIIISNQ